MLKSLMVFTVALSSTLCSFVAVREFISFRDPLPLLSVLAIVFILGVTRILPSSAASDRPGA